MFDFEFIQKIKDIARITTSEKLFSLPDYVDNSCPKIDEAIESAKYSKDYCEVSRYKNEEIDELFEKLGNAEWEISETMGKIDNIREINSNIREWGEEWKKLAKDLFFELAKRDVKKALEYISLADEQIEEIADLLN